MSLSSTVDHAEDVDVLGAGDQLGTLGNTDGRLQFITCQHPHLHRKHTHIQTGTNTGKYKQNYNNSSQSWLFMGLIKTL